MERCPKCGCEEYYIKYHYSGNGIFRVRFDGTETENGDMYECLDSRQTSKYAYCCNCDKRLFDTTVKHD